MSLLQKYYYAMSVLGTEWKEIEEKLETPEAENIIHLLLAYVDAKVAADKSSATYFSITRQTHPVTKERWAAEEEANAVYLQDNRTKEAANTALKIALVGKEEFSRLRRLKEEKEEAFERLIQADLEG